MGKKKVNLRPVLVNWRFLETLCGKENAAEAKRKLKEREEKRNERINYGDSSRHWR